MSVSGSNRFLQSLSGSDRNLLLTHSKEVFLPQKMVVFNPLERPAYAYFLTSGLLSSIWTTANGQSAEVGVTGCEGVVNAVLLLGPAKSATQGIIQIEATGLRIPFADLQHAFRTSEPIRNRLLEFVQSEAIGALAISGCHRLHTTEERLAHWLLMVHDRVGTIDLPLTQTFLAIMLGSGRPTVTLVAGSLQQRGVLELHRGVVTVLNMEKLEAAACECYGTTKHLFRTLYTDTPR